jgi:hypothetical protein
MQTHWTGGRNQTETEMRQKWTCSPAGPGNKNDCSGEGQQQFIRNRNRREKLAVQGVIKAMVGGGEQYYANVVYTQYALSCNC